MKTRVLITMFLFQVSFLHSQTLQNTLKENQEVIILQEELYDQVSWVNGDHRIAFVSKFEGNRNIYFIELRTTSIDKMSKNIFRASYLSQQSPKKLIYKPLTEPGDTNYYQPDWSPLGNDIVCLGDYENKNEVLLIRVVDKKITSTGLHNIHLVHWFTNDELYYVENKNRKKLFKYNRITEQKTEIKEYINIYVLINGQIIIKDGITIFKNPIKKKYVLYG